MSTRTYTHTTGVFRYLGKIVDIQFLFYIKISYHWQLTRSTTDARMDKSKYGEINTD